MCGRERDTHTFALRLVRIGSHSPCQKTVWVFCMEREENCSKPSHRRTKVVRSYTSSLCGCMCVPARLDGRRKGGKNGSIPSPPNCSFTLSLGWCVLILLSVSKRLACYYYYYGTPSTLLRRLLNAPCCCSTSSHPSCVDFVWTPCESSLRVSFRIVLSLFSLPSSCVYYQQETVLVYLNEKT